MASSESHWVAVEWAGQRSDSKTTRECSKTLRIFCRKLGKTWPQFLGKINHDFAKPRYEPKELKRNKFSCSVYKWLKVI